MADVYDSWLCIVHSPCTAQQIGAFIAAGASVLTVLASSGVGLLVWRSSDKNSAAARAQATQLEQMRQTFALEEEVAKRQLDEAVAVRRVQLVRLRELQRSAESTVSRASALSHLQYSRDNTTPDWEEFASGFLESAGHFLREAAAIFAPPELGAPNLPAESEQPLLNLRRATVRVTLLLNLETDTERSRMSRGLMKDAMRELQTAVLQFKQMVAQQEAAHRGISCSSSTENATSALPKDVR